MIEATRNTMPEITPVQCSRLSDGLTTDPARCRVGRTVNTVGASTAPKKMIPPIHTISDNNMRNFRMDIGFHYCNMSLDRHCHALHDLAQDCFRLFGFLQSR